MSASSAVADHLQLRHSRGHELADAARLLPDYLDTQGLTTVTVEAGVEWAQQPAAARVCRIVPRRLSVVRGFARYLSGIDAATQIPPLRLTIHCFGRRPATP